MSQIVSKNRLVSYNNTPHVRAGGKVIGVGVHVYIYICMFVDQKMFESYFSDRLTFSNICGRTSRLIYRLSLLLLSPETLSSSSKSRIFLYNAHLALFVRMNDTITRTNTSVSNVI